MPEGVPSLLIAIIVLVFLSGLFSATETAYSSLNEIKIKSLVQQNLKYKKVSKLFNKYDKLMTTVLVGNNVVNLTAVALSVIMFMKWLPQGANYALISTIIMTLCILLVGEVTPRFLAKVYPEQFSLLVYPLIIVFYYLLMPITLLLCGYKALIKKIFKINKEETITDDELLTIVNEAEEDGTLKEDESDLIRSALEFDDLEVGDIFIPRINVIAVSIEDDIESIKSKFDGEAYSRLPVYKENIDEIIGTIHHRDFYQNYNKDGFKLSDIVKEAVFVGEHTKISSLLKKMQSKKIHMAVVLDEYGGTLGIVTVEDIIEELVGEIYDEYDEEIKPIITNDDGTLTVNGEASLDDFFDLIELVPDEEFEANTVGGFVTEQLLEMPTVGKIIEYKHVKIEVTKITKKRVVQVKAQIMQDKIENDEDNNEE